MPPVAENVCEYVSPTVPGNTAVVERRSCAGFTTSKSAFEALCPALSPTCTVNVKLPFVVGVPLRTPVVSFKVSPGIGRFRDQRYGGVPFAAASTNEYATPTVAKGSGEEVATEKGGGLTVSCSVFWVESLTRTVKMNVPAVVGVPEMTPDGIMNRPGGSDPPTTDHE
jgi:hypothetical protein